MPKTPLLPPLEACREQALKLLDMRPHSEAELRRKLAQRQKYSPEDIRAVMADLQRLGLVDDHAFARLFCDSLKAQGIGKLKARLKMRTRGLSAALIQETLERQWEMEDDGELERAQVVAERKWRMISRIDKPLMNKRQRLARFLAGRGFSSDIIRLVLDKQPFC
ncbi:MAG: regulatory protein RecX [Victivallales bacterium]|nr:regulatory protein RecX [Victivallales bacterium]